MNINPHLMLSYLSYLDGFQLQTPVKLNEISVHIFCLNDMRRTCWVKFVTANLLLVEFQVNDLKRMSLPATFWLNTFDQFIVQTTTNPNWLTAAKYWPFGENDTSITIVLDGSSLNNKTIGSSFSLTQTRTEWLAHPQAIKFFSDVLYTSIQYSGMELALKGEVLFPSVVQYLNKWMNLHESYCYIKLVYFNWTVQRTGRKLLNVRKPSDGVDGLKSLSFQNISMNLSTLMICNNLPNVETFASNRRIRFFRF